MKKLFCLLLAIAVMVCMTVPMYALDGDVGTIQPRWDYMYDMDVSLSFSGTTGIAAASVSRIYSVTTQLSGTLTVYEIVNGREVYVDSTSGTSTRSLSLSIEFDGDSGSEYVAVFEVTAYSGSLSESDSAEDRAVCP